MVVYGETADEAAAKLKARLESEFDGQAAGMLLASRVVEVRKPATGENLGRQFIGTAQELNRMGASWIWADRDPANWPARIEGFYTDEAGSAVLFVLDWNEEE